MGFPGGSMIKNTPAIQEMQKTWVQSLGQEDPWNRKWQPTPLFLPGKFHGQRSLLGYGQWRYKKLKMAEHARVWVCACSDTQLCPTICLDYSPPGSSVHGIFQARIVEWVAISFSRGSSRPRDWTRVSCISWIAGRFSKAQPPGKPILTDALLRN